MKNFLQNRFNKLLVAFLILGLVLNFLESKFGVTNLSRLCFVAMVPPLYASNFLQWRRIFKS
jgi:hypothetical protein